MSAPSGPGRSRANSRSRGSTRGVTGGGTGRGRDARNGIPAGYIGRRQTPGVGTGAETQKRLKARPKRDQVYNKTWRNPAHLSSAKTEHEGRLPGSRNETWRNAASEDSSTYQKRMNDLYQTVCVPKLTRLTERPPLVTLALGIFNSLKMIENAKGKKQSGMAFLRIQTSLLL